MGHRKGATPPLWIIGQDGMRGRSEVLSGLDLEELVELRPQ
jgi:hypothetical protein